MREVVLEESGRYETSGDELGMNFWRNASGFERRASFHGFVKGLGLYHVGFVAKEIVEGDESSSVGVLLAEDESYWGPREMRSAIRGSPP